MKSDIKSVLCSGTVATLCSVLKVIQYVAGFTLMSEHFLCSTKNFLRNVYLGLSVIFAFIFVYRCNYSVFILFVSGKGIVHYNKYL